MKLLKKIFIFPFILMLLILVFMQFRKLPKEKKDEFFKGDLYRQEAMDYFLSRMHLQYSISSAFWVMVAFVIYLIVS